MKIPAFLLGGLVLGPLLFSAQPLRIQSDGCELLKAADLTALLGGAPIATPNGGGCSWTAAGSPKKLLSVKLKASGPAAASAFLGARRAAARGGKGTVTDEVGIGDKAFSSLESFGVVMVMLKQGRLLQLQYWTGAAGTAQDLAALRPVAKKASAAF
jgi:hypothetical protein